MRLLEFQAKRILKDRGIPVPKGVLVSSPEDLNQIALPAVLKAQVPVGGRGKAGAIRRVNQPKEAQTAIQELFASTVKGYPVAALLAEEPVEIKREVYIAYLIDKQVNLPLLMASSAGGVDIEEVARSSPSKIIKKHIDPILGVQDFMIRSLAKALKIDDTRSLWNLIQAMVTLFHEVDASLVEINPLAITSGGMVALDAKLILDDKAAYRHKELFETLQSEQKRLDRRKKTLPEELAEGTGVTYVPLDGDIGIIADGAGTGMLTLDLIHEFGGRAANFCEMGGLSNAGTMEKAIEVILANPRVRVLLIGLIGGMTRMDEMAEGIVQYIQKTKRDFPMAIRMVGTKADVGKAKLQEVGIEPFEDLSAAVEAAVERAKGL
jgi:succinyl-CoA synthetase beta subunit